MSSPRSLWIFHNPRDGQVRSILELLASPPFTPPAATAGTVMGRLDYLFFRLADGWRADARRLDERFGSDHYAVLGRFSH